MPTVSNLSANFFLGRLGQQLLLLLRTQSQGRGSSHAPARATTALPVLALLASIAARYTTRLPITCATLSPRPTLLLLVPPPPDLPIDRHRPATGFDQPPLPHHLNATAASPSPRFSSDLQSRPINQRHATLRPIRLAFTSRLCIYPSPPCASCTPRRFLTRQACRIPDSTAGQRIRAVYLARRRLVLMRTGVALWYIVLFAAICLT